RTGLELSTAARLWPRSSSPGFSARVVRAQCRSILTTARRPASTAGRVWSFQQDAGLFQLFEGDFEHLLAFGLRLERAEAVVALDRRALHRPFLVGGVA